MFHNNETAMSETNGLRSDLIAFYMFHNFLAIFFAQRTATCKKWVWKEENVIKKLI
jgi:hypothetical protein